MKPTPRYSATMDYIPKIRCVAIYGGRNDNNNAKPIFDDVWLLKVENLEYQRMVLGGKVAE